MSDGRIRCARCDAVVRGSLCTTCGAAVESAGVAPAAAHGASTDVPAAVPTAPVVQPALASTPPPTGPPLAAPVLATPSGERSRLVPILIAACVAVAIVTAGVVAAVSLSGGGDETADPSATTATVSTTTIITTTTSTTVPAPAAPAPVQPPTVFVPVPVPSAPVGGGSSASQSGPGSGAGNIETELVGPWVAVAASIPKSESGSRSRAESVASSTFMPGYLVVVLDSDQFPGFNGGYWAVSGISMYSRSEAYDACLSSGLGVTGDGAGGECYPANVVNGDR
jgi:hypothetical protein